MNYVYTPHRLKFNITIWHVKDERFKKYRVLRNSVNDHSTEDSLQRILGDWYWILQPSFSWQTPWKVGIKRAFFHKEFSINRCEKQNVMNFDPWPLIKILKKSNPTNQLARPFALWLWPVFLCFSNNSTVQALMPQVLPPAARLVFTDMLTLPLPNQYSNKWTLQEGHLSLICFKCFLQESTTIILRTWAIKLKKKKKKKRKGSNLIYSKNPNLVSKDTRPNLQHWGIKNNNDIHGLKHVKYTQIWTIIIEKSPLLVNFEGCFEMIWEIKIWIKH